MLSAASQKLLVKARETINKLLSPHIKDTTLKTQECSVLHLLGTCSSLFLRKDHIYQFVKVFRLLYSPFFC